MNDLFHYNGTLDKQYLRTCAVYKMLMRQHSVTKEQAIDLLGQCKVKNAKAVVELWLANPPQSFA